MKYWFSPWPGWVRSTTGPRRSGSGSSNSMQCYCVSPHRKVEQLPHATSGQSFPAVRRVFPLGCSRQTDKDRAELWTRRQTKSVLLSSQRSYSKQTLGVQGCQLMRTIGRSDIWQLWKMHLHYSCICPGLDGKWNLWLRLPLGPYARSLEKRPSGAVGAGPIGKFI